MANEYKKTPTLAKLKIGETTYWLKDAEAREVIDEILKDYLTSDDKTTLEGLISAKQDKIEAGKELSADLIADGMKNHVFTAEDDTKLAGISEGATKVEASTTNGTIKIDGVETTVYTPEEADVYTIAKDASSGDYAAVYHLTKNGENVGEAINIPKDMVLKSGSVVEEGGKTYIRLVLNDAAETKIDVEVGKLVDIYTSGTGVTVDSTSRQISIDRDTVDTWYEAAGEVKKLEDGQVATNKSNIEALQGTVGDASKGLVKDVADLKTTVGDVDSGLVKKVADLEAKSTNVTKSDTNGNIKVDGEEVQVYRPAEGTVVDTDYHHVSVSVTDGVTANGVTYKYDDTELAGRVAAFEEGGDHDVAALEEVVGDSKSGLVKKVADLEAAGATKVEASKTNGNIKINDVETTVYDDTTLAGKVTTLEGYFTDGKANSAAAADTATNADKAADSDKLGGKLASAYEEKANLGQLAYADTASGTVSGQTISGVKATGDITGSVEIAGTDEDITSTGKFTPEGTVSVTLNNNEVLGSVKTAGKVTEIDTTKFSGGTLADASKDSFVKKGVKFSVEADGDENCLCLEYAAATETDFYGQAVTEQGTYTPAALADGFYTKGTDIEFNQATVGVASASFDGDEGDIEATGSYRKITEGSATVTASGVSLNVGDITVAAKDVTVNPDSK